MFFLSPSYLHYPECIKEAAPQLPPWPRCVLHSQTVHGPTEDHGGGEGESGGGLPASEETETTAARGPDCRSGKTQKPSVTLKAVLIGEVQKLRWSAR